jgi:hypothetical protein
LARVWENKLSHTAVENQTWYNYYEEQFGKNQSKFKKYNHFGLLKLLLEIYAKDNHMCVKCHMYKNNPAVSNVRAKDWGPTTCLGLRI